MFRFLATLTVCTLSLLSPIIAQHEWEIDRAHSAAQFSVRHMMVSNVRGEFAKMTGTAYYDPANPATARIEVTIDATSISTRESRRDDHLKGPDFFDVANHPTITFKSKQVRPLGNGKMQVTGDLTMRGVTREVALDVTGPTPEIKDQRGNGRIGASATTRVNRKDFGIAWSRLMDGGGLVVADEVDIILDVELVRKQPAKETSSLR